jgi:protein gp37
MAETSIEWATHVWNPTTGCDRVSKGCDNCYALTMAKRLKGMGAAKYQRDGDPATSGPGFGVTEHRDTLNDPFGWRKPRRVFVNSMSDLFHDAVSEGFIAQVFAAMAATPKHTYLILTKRHARMRSLLRKWAPVTGVPPWVHTGEWPLPNVWLGVSAEDQHWADIRVPALLETPAAVRFLSCEPLLGPVDLRNLKARNGALIDCLGGDVKSATDGVVYTGTPSVVDWVIVGGESGPGARPMHPDWARSLRDQCVSAGVPYHFKQRGAFTWETAGGGNWPEPDLYVNDVTGEALPEHAVPTTGSWKGVWRIGKKRAGRELDGRTWDQFPAVAPC